jgi:sarcosine oxidase
MHDAAVVGLGLIGASTLRHLAHESTDVIGIGPPEPDVWSSHRGPFASHYDSGRITRRLDARLEWAVLASRSIEQYPAIERAAGVRFHRPVGCMFVRRDLTGIAHQRRVVSQLKLPVTIGSTDQLPERSDRYSLPSGWTVLNEPAPAGHIDPRTMLRAQLVIAAAHGAQIERTSVTGVARRRGGGFRIRCANGRVVDAARVLVATGAYMNGLLPAPLAASVLPEAIVLGRIARAEAARLSGLPSLIHLLDHASVDDVYVVPPTRYPDGHFYVKMGGSNAAAVPLRSADEMREWMAGGAADGQLPVMESILRALLPGVSFEGFTMKPCLITDTIHGLPFVDQVEDGLFVAAGGNGHAAKSADAIGALAAGLVRTGAWPDRELERSAFSAVYGDYEPGAGSRHGN